MSKRLKLAVLFQMDNTASFLSIDAVTKTLTFSPVKIPCKVPLLTFADWENKIVPMVEFILKDGVVEDEFYSEDL